MSGQQSSFFENMKLPPSPNSVHTGERPIFLSYAIVFFPSCNILGLMFLGRHLNKVGGFDLKALRGDGER